MARSSGLAIIGRRLLLAPLVAALTIASTACGDHGRSTPAPTKPMSPEEAASAPLPPISPSEAATTSTALRNDAAPVLTFRTASEPLLSLSSIANDEARAATCRTVGADLDSKVSPTALFRAIQAVPDATLRDISLASRRIAADLLVACVAKDRSAVDDLATKLRSVDEVFDRRLSQL